MANQIAVKNLQGLNDILDAEKLNREKLEFYKSSVQDEKLKRLIMDLSDASARHYNSVYEYLKSHKC